MNRRREVEVRKVAPIALPYMSEHKVSSRDGPRTRSTGPCLERRDARWMGAAGRGAREPAGRGGRIFAGLLGGGCGRARGNTCCGHAARAQRGTLHRKGGGTHLFSTAVSVGSSQVEELGRHCCSAMVRCLRTIRLKMQAESTETVLAAASRLI